MKAKSSILTVVLSLFLASGLLAQEKAIYEYATVKYTTPYSVTFTTQDNEEVTKTTGKDLYKDVIKKVNQLVSQGWEVFAVSSEVCYHLRKKKTQ